MMVVMLMANPIKHDGLEASGCYESMLPELHYDMERIFLLQENLCVSQGSPLLC